MARENNYLAIILKKQPYGEGDEILTMFTREAGKIRAVAKSVKLPKSKLQYSLQSLFLSKIATTGSSALPKIIRAEAVQTYSGIRENYEAAKMAYFAIEMLVKFTADEHKNEGLYELAMEFLEFLSGERDKRALLLGLAKFKIGFLEKSGLGIHCEEPGGAYRQAGFSNYRGGFLFDERAADFRPVPEAVLRLFKNLSGWPFSSLPGHLAEGGQGVKEEGLLQEILTGFLKHQLERDIKSEKFLKE